MNDPRRTLRPLSLSAKAARTHEQPITYLIATAMANPGLINLAAGLVDADTLPIEETAAACKAILSDPVRAKQALQYDTTVGLSELRQLCLKHIEDMEGKPALSMGLRPQDVLVTTGSQQALYLTAEALLDPGDIVIAANPSYFVYTGTLGSFGANVIGAPMTDDGLDIDAVEKILETLDREKKLDKLKLIYCTSYFQNPTGLTLVRGVTPATGGTRKAVQREDRSSHPHSRRRGLSRAPLRRRGDAVDQVVRCDQRIRHPHAHVLQALRAGIKTGYTAMPEDLMHAILQQKGNHDFGSANLCMQIALETLRSGSYHKHVQVLIDAYRAKRDAVLECTREAHPERRRCVRGRAPRAGCMCG